MWTQKDNSSNLENFFENNKHLFRFQSEYFLRRMPEILSEEFIGTESDVLNSWRRTTGIDHELFAWKGQQVELVDVGAQRSERRKWVHVLENNDGVVFVASMSDFDEFLFEDGNVVSMREAIQVFHETVQREEFRQIPFFLVFTKLDVLQRKLEFGKFSDFLDGYAGDNTVEAVSKAVEGLFMKGCSRDGVVVLRTQANDPSRVEQTMDVILGCISAHQQE